MTASSPGPDEVLGLAEELSGLEQELLRQEMELATAEGDIVTFERRYLEEVGLRLRRIDELRAQIEEATAAMESRVERTTLKQLYRRLAKRLHPDLGVDDKGRGARTTWMARVNSAYVGGDREELEKIERELDEHGIEQEDDGELASFRVRIAQVRRRLAEIAVQRDTLLASSIGQLWAEHRQAATEGRDLLADMATELDDQTRALEVELAALREHR